MAILNRGFSPNSSDDNELTSGIRCYIKGLDEFWKNNLVLLRLVEMAPTKQRGFPPGSDKTRRYLFSYRDAPTITVLKSGA